MYIHRSLCSWHASSFTKCTYVNLIYRVCVFACAHVWIRDEPSQRPTPPLYHHHHQPTMPRLDLPSTKSTESSMQRDVPTTNWCRLANAKCYILCLQALAISKARLCDAVEMHTRNLYRNSKSILERLFSIARLGSQTTMTSSIAPKHMSMHTYLYTNIHAFMHGYTSGLLTSLPRRCAILSKHIHRYRYRKTSITIHTTDLHPRIRFASNSDPEHCAADFPVYYAPHLERGGNVHWQKQLPIMILGGFPAFRTPRMGTH